MHLNFQINVASNVHIDKSPEYGLLKHRLGQFSTPINTDMRHDNQE